MLASAFRNRTMYHQFMWLVENNGGYLMFAGLGDDFKGLCKFLW